MITNHGQAMFDAEMAKMRRESVDAVLIGYDGNRTSGIVDVAVIPDGEHEGEPVTIEPRTQERVAAVEFSGRQFAWSGMCWIEARIPPEFSIEVLRADLDALEDDGTAS